MKDTNEELLQEIREHLKRIESVTMSYMGKMQQSVAEQETRQLESSLEQMSPQDRLERADLFFNRAEQMYFQGLLMEARNEYKKVILADPNHLQALRKMGTLCSINREFDEAILYFKRALKLEPEDLLLYNKILIQYCYMYEDYVAKDAMFERILVRLHQKSQEKGATVQDYYQLAMAHLMFGFASETAQSVKKVQEAINKGLKLDKKNPHLGWAKKWLSIPPGIGKVDKKSIKTAIQSCQEVLDNCPESLLGQAQFELAEVEELDYLCLETKAAKKRALTHYKKCLEHDPYHLGALYRLACLCAGDFQYTNSLDLLQKLVIQDPFHGRALLLLGDIYHQTRFYDKASHSFTRLLEHADCLSYNPHAGLIELFDTKGADLLSVRLKLAKTLESSHKVDEAIAQYREILETIPTAF